MISANAIAQLNYSFSTGQGTYTALVTPTQVTPQQLVTGANQSPATDDGFRNNLAIGFSFVYNGTTYTRFNICTNGFISLGAAFVAGTATSGYRSSNDLDGSIVADSAARPIIAPFWGDLDVQTNATGGGMSYKLSGTAPNRALTIQWKNILWDFGAPAGVMSFQAKLYETTNVIEFIYQREAGSKFNSAAFDGTASIGIAAKGRGAGNFLSVTDTTSTATVSKFGETALTGRPQTGQIYRFTPLPQNYKDLGIQTLMTVGQTATIADPQITQCVLANNGNVTMFNVNVILSITGANTFTDTFFLDSIRANRAFILPFKSFANTTVGINSVTVSVPVIDSNNANNSLTVQQLVTPSHIDYKSKIADGTLGSTTQTFDAAALITNPTTHTVDSIIAYFTATGDTVSVALFDTAGINGTITRLPGNAIWTLAAPVTTVAGRNVFAVTPPQTITGDFFAVVSQISTTNSYRLEYEKEQPLRFDHFALNVPSNNGYIFFENTSGLGFVRPHIGISLMQGTVPVKFSSINAINLDANSNQVNWNTATEQNNAGFVVERSVNGKEFIAIGNVDSKGTNGNSSANLSYSFYDRKALIGTNYYRLKQTDKDGKTSYSTIVSVNNKTRATFNLESVYPNPVVNNLGLKLNTGIATKATVSIVDMNGKVVLNQSLQLIEGLNNTNINVVSLKSGTYAVRVIAENGSVKVAIFNK